MRVRDHLVLSAAAGAALRPLYGRGALAFVAGGVLIDVDHYLWFCLRHRQLDPVAAIRFFNEPDPPQHQATRFLHSPVALLGALALGTRWRPAGWAALGMLLHVALDTRHSAQMKALRARALQRDDFSCRACGTRVPPISTHVSRQPLLLPSYAMQNIVSLCGACHGVAHLTGGGLRT